MLKTYKISKTKEEVIAELPEHIQKVIKIVEEETHLFHPKVITRRKYRLFGEKKVVGIKLYQISFSDNGYETAVTIWLGDLDNKNDQGFSLDMGIIDYERQILVLRILKETGLKCKFPRRGLRFTKDFDASRAEKTKFS